nr:hypothetical protein [Paenarthrobacter sp. MMS21-TAE1-1]
MAAEQAGAAVLAEVFKLEVDAESAPECASTGGFVPEGVLAYEDGVALFQRFNRLDQADAHQGAAVGQTIARLVSAISATKEGVHDELLAVLVDASDGEIVGGGGGPGRDAVRQCTSEGPHNGCDDALAGFSCAACDGARWLGVRGGLALRKTDSGMMKDRGSKIPELMGMSGKTCFMATMALKTVAA